MGVDIVGAALVLYRIGWEAAVVLAPTHLWSIAFKRFLYSLAIHPFTGQQECCFKTSVARNSWPNKV